MQVSKKTVAKCAAAGFKRYNYLAFGKGEKMICYYYTLKNNFRKRLSHYIGVFGNKR